MSRVWLKSSGFDFETAGVVSEPMRLDKNSKSPSSLRGAVFPNAHDVPRVLISLSEVQARRHKPEPSCPDSVHAGFEKSLHTPSVVITVGYSPKPF